MLEAILARLGSQPSRTGALIITLYGDTIAPRGGALWLGTLLEVFRAAGVGDGVVRTACSRLAADAWLQRRRRGRHSFYALSDHGRAETEAAAPTIYGPLVPDWDGRLHVAALWPGSTRDAARDALLAAGWGAVGPLLMIGTRPASAPDGAAMLRAEADPDTIEKLAARAWPLAEVAERYRSFLATFPAAPAPAENLEALVTRMLLVHEYRRAVLRDPHLPSALLPAAWPGFAARARVSTLYAALRAGSEAWLDEHAVAESGPLPAADPTRRFE